MKSILFILLLLVAHVSLAQEQKTVTYRQWQDMPQDTYVRIIHTADSLLVEYKESPFHFEKKDGSCCLNGLMVIKEFYMRALIEKPSDEDAENRVKEILGVPDERKVVICMTFGTPEGRHIPTTAQHGGDTSGKSISHGIWR